MENKVRESLILLREGKAVNPTLLAGMLEWALAREGERAKAERRFEVCRDKNLDLISRLKQYEEGEAIELREQEPEVYTAKLEAALLALDKKGLLECLRSPSC